MAARKGPEQNPEKITVIPPLAITISWTSGRFPGPAGRLRCRKRCGYGPTSLKNKIHVLDSFQVYYLEDFFRLAREQQSAQIKTLTGQRGSGFAEIEQFL